MKLKNLKDDAFFQKCIAVIRAEISNVLCLQGKNTGPFCFTRFTKLYHLFLATHVKLFS